eukprot:124685-Prymnesium_polylepis.2
MNDEMCARDSREAEGRTRRSASAERARWVSAPCVAGHSLSGRAPLESGFIDGYTPAAEGGLTPGGSRTPGGPLPPFAGAFEPALEPATPGGGTAPLP